MENILIGIGIVGLVLVAVVAVIQFVKSDRSTQINKIREWLLFAVIEAEKALGSKTGAAKLSYVYNLFVTKFPVMSSIISFEKFSSLVDEALVKMKEVLDNSEDLQKFIDGLK